MSKSVKDYYFTNIWPRLAPRALSVDEAEDEALRLFPDDPEIRDDFEQMRRLNVPSGRIWIYEEATKDVLKWFSTGTQVRGFSIVVDVEEEFKSERMYVGEFPTGEFNASISQVPETNGFLVLFNSGIVDFLTDIVNISTMWVGVDILRSSLFDELQSDTVTRTPLISENEALLQIDEAVQRYLREDMYYPIRRTAIEKRDLRASAATILFSITKFILAHEFAHCALGHVNANLHRGKELSYAGITLNVIQKSHEEELQADWLAANLPLLKTELPTSFDPTKFYLTPMWGMSIHENAIGGLLFFDLLELVDNCVGENINSLTHPAASARYKNIRALYELILNRSFFRVADLYGSLFKNARRSF